ncbi:hypothetical protein [Rickettsia endosymbiont of Aspidapion aeneum]|uniref:hypothetical protein n=1 Tax=Rickettsia endosymbiont of Aspidapion aeneum TaxID=3066247 RepID=UPI00313DDF5F
MTSKIRATQQRRLDHGIQSFTKIFSGYRGRGLGMTILSDFPYPSLFPAVLNI